MQKTIINLVPAGVIRGKNKGGICFGSKPCVFNFPPGVMLPEEILRRAGSDIHNYNGGMSIMEMVSI